MSDHNDTDDDLDAEVSYQLPPTDFATFEMSYDLCALLETFYLCSHQPEVARDEYGAEFTAQMQEADVYLADYARTRLAGNIAAIEIPLMASIKNNGDFLYTSPFFHADRFYHQRILYGYWRQNLSGNIEDFETNQSLIARLRELRIMDSVLSRAQYYKDMYRHKTNGYYDGGDNRVEDDNRQKFIRPTRKSTREWRISCLAYVIGIGRVDSTMNTGRDLHDLGMIVAQELPSWKELIRQEFNIGTKYAHFNFDEVRITERDWDNVKPFTTHKM